MSINKEVYFGFTCTRSMIRPARHTHTKYNPVLPIICLNLNVHKSTLKHTYRPTSVRRECLVVYPTIPLNIASIVLSWEWRPVISFPPGCPCGTWSVHSSVSGMPHSYCYGLILFLVANTTASGHHVSIDLYYRTITRCRVRVLIDCTAYHGHVRYNLVWGPSTYSLVQAHIL